MSDINVPIAFDDVIAESTWNNVLNRIKDKTHAPVMRMDYIPTDSAFAFVYRIGAERVLKLTPDPRDPSASMLVKGKVTRYIASIFDVFRLATTRDVVDPKEAEKNPVYKNLDTTKLYGLVVEECVDLDSVSKYQGWKDWINEIYEIWYKMPDAGLTSQSIDAIKEAYPELFEDAQKEIWLRGLANELLKFGIVWGDIHAGNIMVSKKKGTPVIIDLGASSSGASLQSIPVVASLVQALLKIQEESIDFIS